MRETSGSRTSHIEMNKQKQRINYQLRSSGSITENLIDLQETAEERLLLPFQPTERTSEQTTSETTPASVATTSSSASTTSASSSTTTESASTTPAITTTATSHTIQMATISTNTDLFLCERKDSVPANLPKFSRKTSYLSASQWWASFIQWCILHTFTEIQIVNRFLFHLSDLAQQWYLALPVPARSSLANLKDSFFLRFGKANNDFDIDVFNIRQEVDESAEEYITRIQQKVWDEEIPIRMLIKLIARGLKKDVADKVLDKDPKTMEDLLKFSKMAESNLRITKGEDVNIIASIENMEERLLTKLTNQLQSVMSMQTEQTDVPSQRGKRRGPSSRPHPHRQFQSFEAEPSQWNFDDQPTYRHSDYRYSKKSQWHSNPSSRKYQNHRDQPQWQSDSPERQYQHQDQPQWQSKRDRNRFRQHQHQQQYNEPSGSQPRQQHPADRPSRYNGSSAPRKCSRCSFNYCEFEKCRAIGHQCNICFRFNHLESVCFDNPESPFYRPKSNFYK